MKPISIHDAATAFLGNIKRAHGASNTYTNYRSNLLGQSGFLSSLTDLKPTSPIDHLNERHGVAYIQTLLDRDLSAATRGRAASCLRSFFGFIIYEYDSPINITKFTYALRIKHLLAGAKETANYPGEKINRVLEFARQMTPRNLQDHRDQAFIWFLAETGLRVSEACSLKIGQIDRKWQISFIGKGGKAAKISAGKNARLFISKYLKARESLDAATGRARSMLPLFSRHDQAAGKDKIKPISSKQAQKLIHNLALLALGDEYDESITCHKFRHYFITAIYQRRGDIKAAQEMARHKDIRTTQRYTHRNSMDNERITKEVFG